MNTQRWIALGMVGLVVLCIASANLWLPIVRGGDEEEAETTPTPETALTEAAEEEGTPESTESVANILTPTPTATLDPSVAEILADLEVEELGVGVDPFITRAGDFTTNDPAYEAEGTASIYQISETQRVLRLESFSVTNGPDLRVILSPHEAPRTSAETLLPTYLDLGKLQSPTGAQNYEVPEGEGLSQYRSVVIYSMSLNIVYASAPLTDVRGQ